MINVLDNATVQVKVELYNKCTRCCINSWRSMEYVLNDAAVQVRVELYDNVLDDNAVI